MTAEQTRIIYDRLALSAAPADDDVALPFELRQKARQTLLLTCGRPAGLMLPRGTLLRHGVQVQSACGQILRIDAAPERVSTVATQDLQLLARTAYHLGNRHVWVQVGTGWLRYLHDHVLDDMVRGLDPGLHLSLELLPFEPEAGAYYEHGAGHSH